MKTNEIKAAIKRVRGELDAANAEVAKLHEQRREVERAPLDREAAKAAARDRVDAAARDGRSEIARAARSVGTPSGSQWHPGEALDEWLNARDSYRLNRSLIVALLSSQYAAAIEAAIDSDPAFDGGMTNEQRTAKLAELDKRIASAEARRDTLERELAEAGLLGGADTDASTEGGDQGMAALREQHERDRQRKNAALKRAGVTERAQPRVINAFDRDTRIAVGED